MFQAMSIVLQDIYRAACIHICHGFIHIEKLWYFGRQLTDSARCQSKYQGLSM